MSDATFMPTREQWERARRDQATWHIARALIAGLVAYCERPITRETFLKDLQGFDSHMVGLRRLLDHTLSAPLDDAETISRLQVMMDQQRAELGRAQGVLRAFGFIQDAAGEWRPGPESAQMAIEKVSYALIHAQEEINTYRMDMESAGRAEQRLALRGNTYRRRALALVAQLHSLRTSGRYLTQACRDCSQLVVMAMRNVRPAVE